eukprot:gb/GECG01016102.1/.p1 GENE.gb/GECG01016102.1/~~gb/GECG01016102.1/.p1  ORF type:complete len:270 (+),score=34.27 gb/GECG01016102.1/:1-810(+)
MASGGDMWTFSGEDISRAPSIAEDSVPQSLMEQALSKTCLVIQRTAAHLFGVNKSHSRNVASIAMIMVHRFYMRQSLQKHDRYKIAAAALFAAAKTEESPKKLVELIKAFQQVIQQDADPHSDAFKRMSRDVLLKERILLNTLEFDFDIVLPYPTISECLKVINKHGSSWGQDSSDRREELKKLASVAHMLAYDCIRIGLPLQYSAEEIGVGCVILASKLMKINMEYTNVELFRNCSVSDLCSRNWIKDRWGYLLEYFFAGRPVSSIDE